MSNANAAQPPVAPTPVIDNGFNYQFNGYGYDPFANANNWSSPWIGEGSSVPSGGGMAGVGIEGMPEDTWAWEPWSGGNYGWDINPDSGFFWKEGGSVDKHAKLKELMQKYN